jgi:hypothetical protein
VRPRFERVGLATAGAGEGAGDASSSTGADRLAREVRAGVGSAAGSSTTLAAFAVFALVVLVVLVGLAIGTSATEVSSSTGAERLDRPARAGFTISATSSTAALVLRELRAGVAFGVSATSSTTLRCGKGVNMGL